MERRIEVTEEMERLNKKRLEVLEYIKPICEAFGIKDYDYVVQETGQTETLKIGNVRIGCSLDSLSAVRDELIGYIFITIWCKNRYLGAFGTQTKNIIKAYWLKN